MLFQIVQNLVDNVVILFDFFEEISNIVLDNALIM